MYKGNNKAFTPDKSRGYSTKVTAQHVAKALQGESGAEKSQQGITINTLATQDKA